MNSFILVRVYLCVSIVYCTCRYVQAYSDQRRMLNVPLYQSLPYCFDTGSLTRPVEGLVVTKSQIFSSSPYNVWVTGSCLAFKCCYYFNSGAQFKNIYLFIFCIVHSPSQHSKLFTFYFTFTCWHTGHVCWQGHGALYMWCSEGQLAGVHSLLPYRSWRTNSSPQAYILTCLASFKVTFKQAPVKTGFHPGLSNFTAGSSCS